MWNNLITAINVWNKLSSSISLVNHFIHIKSFCPMVFVNFFQYKTIFLIELIGELGSSFGSSPFG